MSEQFNSRLIDQASLGSAIQEALDTCGLGSVVDAQLVDVGFEDYNMIVTNDVSEKYFIKVMSRSRDEKSIRRYVSIIDAALAAGVNHPRVYKNADNETLVRTHSGMTMVVMEAVKGKTFYDLDSTPTPQQLDALMHEVVKISHISYMPEAEYDSWAIPHIDAAYEQALPHMPSDAKQLVDQAVAAYNALPLADLPTCFVHGDLTKANVMVGDDGMLYVIDFSVANMYPRIQELVVMATSLMYDKHTPLDLRDRLDILADRYVENGGELTDIERTSMFAYALAGLAMEYLGSLNEQVKNGHSDEAEHWQHVGLQGLKEALR